MPFVLTWYPSHEPLPDEIDPEQALEDAIRYWHDWANTCVHYGPYHDEIHESLLVLKALTYEPTGGIVAAPTTSLPEWIGGVRNWDYRFCWLRDATLTLLAMLQAGLQGRGGRVAGSGCCARSRAIPPTCRSCTGSPASGASTSASSSGCRATRARRPCGSGTPPRRSSSSTSTARCSTRSTRRAPTARRPTTTSGRLSRNLLAWLEENWRREDSGLWEVRGPDRHFTHSKVMAWVAFDRGVRACEDFGREGPVDRWRAIRDEIKDEVLERGWSDAKQSFTQSYESEALDASVLVMPIVGFLPATDPRIVSTVAALERELLVDGLVLRYRPADEGVDGLPGGEGVFLACSFWLVEVLALQDREDEATALFERLLALRNDVGLLAEEYDPRSGRQLGNFPQAFTHLALVEAAIALGEGRGIREGT